LGGKKRKAGVKRRKRKTTPKRESNRSSIISMLKGGRGALRTRFYRKGRTLREKKKRSEDEKD